MHNLEHILTAVLVVVFPLHAWYMMRRTKTKLRESGADPRDFDAVTEYRHTILTLVGLATACLVMWFSLGRPADTIGLGFEATPLRWFGGAAIALLGLVITYVLLTRMRDDDTARAETQAQLADMAFVLPKTPRELNWFTGVALTAGVCEEILYRGFLIWYFATWIGTVPALLVAAIAFGIAHLYQGKASIPQVVLIALWMGAIYVVSGTLWFAMIAHFVYDVIVGRIVYSITSGGNTAARAATS